MTLRKLVREDYRIKLPEEADKSLALKYERKITEKLGNYVAFDSYSFVSRRGDKLSKVGDILSINAKLKIFEEWRGDYVLSLKVLFEYPNNTLEEDLKIIRNGLKDAGLEKFVWKPRKDKPN